MDSKEILYHSVNYGENQTNYLVDVFATDVASDGNLKMSKKSYAFGLDDLSSDISKN